MNSFNQKAHMYLIDGKRATGITTIIGTLAKPQLIPWAARMATESVAKNWQPNKSYSQDEIDTFLGEAKIAHSQKRDNAADFGTNAHKEVENYINECIKSGSTLDIKNEQIQKFIDWAVVNVKTFLFAERIIYNKRLFIAGTIDFGYIGKDGKRYIGDFKTSSGIYGASYFLQVGAYRMLAEEDGDQEYDGTVIARLGKDGKFEVQYLYEFATIKKCFLSCLNLYRLNADIKNLIIK